VSAKYTVQALLPCSVNPKFSTGKRYKLYTNFTFCFSFWGPFIPRRLIGTLPLNPTGSFRPSGPVPIMWTPSVVKSWVRLCRGDETSHMNSRIIITAGLGVPLSTSPSTILFDIWFYFILLRTDIYSTSLKRNLMYYIYVLLCILTKIPYH